MWSDNETETDLLGFEHLVTAVTSIVNNEALLPATIGVYGDWGSGKSSLLKMIAKQFEGKDGVVLLSFNGWLFEGFDDAKTALMGTILDEIISRKLVSTEVKEGAKRLGWKLLKQVDVMRVMGFAGRTAMAGLTGGIPGALLSVGKEAVSGIKNMTEKVGDAKLTVEEIAAQFKENSEDGVRRGIRDFRKDFADLLKESGITKLIVVIDDLDRCLPETILETLEAIKLFLFVPRTAFILGADERLVKYAVRRRFPELPGQLVEVGSDYLEKLIQYPVYIPPLGRGEMETYINLLFAKLAGVNDADFEAARKQAVQCEPNALLAVRFNYAIAKALLKERTPSGLDDSLATAQRIADVFARESGNPRQCKRFLNTLMLRLVMARSRNVELKQRVLAKLMLLERFRPESFRSLADAQAKQAGKPKELALAEKLLTQAVAPPIVAADTAEESIADIQTKVGGKSPRKAKTHAEPSDQSDEADEPASLPLWLSEEWIQEWVRSEPPLADENLQQYFFFSRDKVGAMASATQRLTARAQEVLAKLVGASEAYRRAGLQELKQLSGADVAGLLDALSERARTEEGVEDEKSAIFVLLRFPEVRPEMFGQVLTLLSNLPDSQVPFTVPIKLVSLASSNPTRRAPVESLLKRWEGGAIDPQLRNGAAAAIKRLR
jgi:KAP-like P-loop domain-containing protein